MSEKLYDVMILGGGPAGLSAAIYAGRSGRSVLLVEGGPWGGQISQTAEIDNYPGGIKGESGLEFSERLSGQARSFGCEMATDRITGVDIGGEAKELAGASETYKGKTLIIATGNVPRKLGAPGEEEFTGRGVSYCATCDAPFFTGLEVYVAGGGDSAVEEALYLAKFARKVTIIHRRDQLRAAKSIQEKAAKAPNVGLLLDTVVAEIKGEGLLTSLVVENTKTGERKELFAENSGENIGLFVFTGHVPSSGLFLDLLDTEGGFIVTDEDMSTGAPGVFAAGDVRKKALRQVVTAAADGAVAAYQADRYLDGLPSHG